MPYKIQLGNHSTMLFRQKRLFVVDQVASVGDQPSPAVSKRDLNLAAAVMVMMPPRFSKRPRRLRSPGSRHFLQQLTYSGYFPSCALDDVDGPLKNGRFFPQKRQVFVTQLDQVLEVDYTGSCQLETGTDCGYGGGVVEGDIEEESFVRGCDAGGYFHCFHAGEERKSPSL